MDVETRNALAEKHRWLVAFFLRRLAYHPKVYRLRHDAAARDDMLQAGFLGLMIAVERFEPERGVKFSAYAGWWICRYLLEEAHRQHVIHVPRYLDDSDRRTNKSAATVAAAQRARLTFFIGDDSPLDPHAIGDPLAQAEDEAALQDAIGSLPVRDQVLLVLYYWEGLTMQQIGQRLSLTRQRVSQRLLALYPLLRKRLDHETTDPHQPVGAPSPKATSDCHPAAGRPAGQRIHPE